MGVRVLALSLAMMTAAGCASLHHVQVGEIDNRGGDQIQVPFSIKVSQMGVDTDDVYDLIRASHFEHNQDLRVLVLLVMLSQMGPYTGNPVYDVSFARNLGAQIYAQCPSGRVSGLMSVRESATYPVISGEVVKVTGYCAMDRTKITQGDI